MNENSAHPPAWMTGAPTDGAQHSRPQADGVGGLPEAPAADGYGANGYASDGHGAEAPQQPYYGASASPYGVTEQPQNEYPQNEYAQHGYVQGGYGQESQQGFTPPAPEYGAAPASGYPVQQPQAHQQPYGAPPQGYGPPQQPPMGAAPRAGWRRSLQNMASGFVSFGGTRKKDEIAQLAARVRQPIRNDFRLAVLSLKGGVGKTTVTVGLGSALASLRGDRVIAVDANPDLGTLARRIPAQTASTVRDLLQDPHLERYMDVRKHTSQAPSRLEVLASERDPAISEAFSEDEYLRVIEILENHYNMIITDCGTGLVHSAMAGVMKSATSLVLVTSPALDGAQSAVATLDWLVAHGYEQIARETVVVIAASKTRNAPVDINMLREYFLGRTRAVQIIPYDEHLAVGGFIDLDAMKPATRSAFLELAATLVEPFVIQQQQPYIAGPFGGMMPPQGPSQAPPQY